MVVPRWQRGVLGIPWQVSLGHLAVTQWHIAEAPSFKFHAHYSSEA
ncbi:hypothetical protein ACPOL_1880 [Acidisarcina polymorpha]|uniref:Uncharacterized protein n=1 Tax=Acidisarcina polymorpha TaxID=2211140 RepID=A0A2Z5FWY2_9BACT|nr:hypothetical protein ACPOL_1880 [Acidisarcina polymorpha]